MSETPDRDSKTEEPTDKRLMEALNKGKGPLSRDVPLLLNVFALWLAFSFLAGAGATDITLALRPFIEEPGRWRPHTATDAAGVARFLIVYALGPLAPVLIAMVLSGVLGSAPHSHGVVLDRIRPDLSRISPFAGWGRLFGRAGLSNALKSTLKLAFVGGFAVWALHDLSAAMLATAGAGVEVLAPALASALTRLLATTLIAFVTVAILDAVLSRYIWRRGLMMTRQEVKDEAKDSNGDPAIRLRMRLLARQRLKKRMLVAVPRATVVIANPTHYAVALRYVPAEGGAPQVLAKGRDRIALRIRAVAEQHAIPVVEDRVLARALHDAVPVDALIPPEFYKAVARIISFLMQPGHRRKG